VPGHCLRRFIEVGDGLPEFCSAQSRMQNATVNGRERIHGFGSDTIEEWRHKSVTVFSSRHEHQKRALAWIVGTRGDSYALHPVLPQSFGKIGGLHVPHAIDLFLRQDGHVGLGRIYALENRGALGLSEDPPDEKFHWFE
jgi:hypothetical protein